MEYKDYYKILGVSKDASMDDIKKAFRKLAVKYHPDKNPGDTQAEKRFHEINEAHEVLTDPEKRKHYDQYGQNWERFQNNENRAEGFDWSAFTNGTGGASRFETSFNCGDFFSGGHSDFFEALFGNSFGGWSNRAQARPAEKYESIAELSISLQEAYSGTSKLFNFNSNTIKLNIKPGTSDGQLLRLKNRADSSDLLVKILVQHHPTFERKGDDLYCSVNVDFYKMLLGGKVKLQSMKGAIELKIPPETQNGQTMKLSGLGMPVFGRINQFGNLYVKINAILPTNLNEQERNLFEQLKEFRKNKDTCEV